jgi:hypothetical protein
MVSEPEYLFRREAECTEAEAEFVRLRLTCWASKEGEVKAVPDLPEHELTALVQGYPDEKLAELYRSATGSEWRRMLSEEIGRRDALGPGAAQQ